MIRRRNWAHGPGRQKTKTKGKNCILVTDHAQIVKMYAEDKPLTYAHIAVSFRPQKLDPNRVHITVGGNLIKCPGGLTARIIEITTTKIVWDSIISTKQARYACLDVDNVYLVTPLKKYKYTKMPLVCFRPGHASIIIWMRTRTKALCARKVATPFTEYCTQAD